MIYDCLAVVVQVLLSMILALYIAYFGSIAALPAFDFHKFLADVGDIIVQN
jgi:hypothetical protein